MSNKVTIRAMSFSAVAQDALKPGFVDYLKKTAMRGLSFPVECERKGSQLLFPNGAFANAGWFSEDEPNAVIVDKSETR